MQMNIAEHIKDPHVIAAFNDMARRGAAEFMLRDDGVLLMSIRNKSTEEVLFKVTRLAHFETLSEERRGRRGNKGSGGVAN
jgi:hypothetical protein